MKERDRNKIYGIIATIIFHLAALILLFTLCFRTPLPLPGEAGVEVNLGMYNAIKTSAAAPVANKAEPQQKEEEILSKDEETPAIEPQQKSDNQDDNDTIQKVEEEPVVNRRALFQTPTNNQVENRDDSQEGLAGNQNGLKDIDRYDGNGGSGGGLAYDLGGRGAKSLNSPSKNFKEEGKVVVDIWVDKDGIVRRAEIGKGTTVTDLNMRESALQAASSSIFAEDKNAAELQRGTITYTFIIRQ